MRLLLVWHSMEAKKGAAFWPATFHTTTYCLRSQLAFLTLCCILQQCPDCSYNCPWQPVAVTTLLFAATHHAKAAPLLLPLLLLLLLLAGILSHLKPGAVCPAHCWHGGGRVHCCY
jgi:hypothetical protein